MLLRGIFLTLILGGALVVFGCGKPVAGLSRLAKSEIDMVADTHLRQTESLMKRLAIKLYKRNPIELKKGKVKNLDKRLKQLFNENRDLLFPEINNKQGVDAILLAFEPEYPKDRVFALMVGLISMVRSSYGNQPEFFLFDRLEPQSLYNSARNIEVLVWRLKSRIGPDGKPILLTNGFSDEGQNLSFERLFGKLISLQDMMARVASQKWNRTINFIVHQAAAATFLPVGF